MEQINYVENELLRVNDLPSFSAGDTVTVHYKIKEGGKERTQLFKGVVIQRKGKSTTETFTVRKISSGVGVERIFPVLSPAVEKIEVNKEEAKSGSFFRGGWRPATGWCCVIALFYAYIAQPCATFVLAQTGHLVQLPNVDMSTMMPILLGMLGLAGARSFERVKGKA